MPDTEPVANTALDPQTLQFLDGQAETLDTTRDDLLQRLVAHYRTACESGLSCPHCNNELLIDI
ncbi:hypothetical protein [Haloarchaeobius litoreus]|uniref:Ribbon-helix-helix protein, copG family n=1 Tax=Haloarchaeobius litoreus TaxID=755306 RepID=A0ABD6DP79_9EURY|nr:hypothetical protein [Haloarchaeobius litoreus]